MSTALLTPWAAASTGFGLSASLIVAIGAQNAFVLRQGLRREHVGAVVLICALLDALLMAAGVAGLGAGVADRPRLLDALTLLGAALLAAYALSAFRRAAQPHALKAASAAGATPLPRVAAQVLAISLLNPHVYLDTVLLVGAVGARQGPGLHGAFWAGAALASATWFVVLGYGARTLAPLFARPRAWQVLDGLVGLTMAAIAWKLAASVLLRA